MICKMFKRLVSGAIALSMILTMSSVSTFADSYDDETMDEVVAGNNYWESSNFVVQDFLEGMDESSTIYEIKWNDGNKDKNGNDKIGHSDIAEYVNEKLSEKYPSKAKNELCECLVYGSYIADNQDLHHDKGTKIDKNKPNFYPKLHHGAVEYDDYATQLHAVSKITDDNTTKRPKECGNYLLYLECLWLYAKYAGINGYVKYSHISLNYLGSNPYRLHFLSYCGIFHPDFV